MTMWLVRAGKSGERESLALASQCAVVGWDELPDLGPYHDRIELERLIRTTYPEQKPRTLQNWHGQVWSVRDTIKIGDLVVLPLKTRAEVALGVVSGDYQYRRDLPGVPLHTRPVEWLAQVPRRAFDIDILLSFGAFMTVCRIERNDAEQRVRELLATYGRSSGAELRPAPRTALRPAPQRCPAPPAFHELEERSFDLIRDRIAQKFKGHHLATLIASLLEVQGYRTRVSPPGPDGGVDILAGSGPLGFESPRIVVQVKSQDTKVDVRILREIAGVMGRFQADHGLLVGWGGFHQSVRAEAASDYFRIRLCDASDVVAAVKEHYPKLPAALRAQVPLQQVWTLVTEAQNVAA